MYGYRIFYSAFDEIVTSKGDLYRGVEQPGGMRVWLKIETDVDMIDHLRDIDDYYVSAELDGDEILAIVQ